MQINILPFINGWRWMTKAGNLFGQNISGFANLAIIWMVIGWLDIIPVIGSLVLALITPGLIAGAMHAYGNADNRQPVRGMQLLTVLLGERRTEALQLGLLMLLLGFLGMLVIVAFISASIPEWRSLADLFATQADTAAQTEAMLELLSKVNILPLMVVIILVVGAISAALFFAIPRVVFDKCLFSGVFQESIMVCIRNWRSMLMFGLAQVVVVFAGSIMLSILVVPLSLLPGAIQTVVVGALFGLFIAFIQILIAGGQYLAWCEIFETQDKNPEDTGARPDQLTA